MATREHMHAHTKTDALLYRRSTFDHNHFAEANYDWADKY